MVRDLAEFGYPNAVINTARISYAALFTSGIEGLETAVHVKIVCDGALLSFEFDGNNRAEAEALFQFFKSCAENAVPAS